MRLTWKVAFVLGLVMTPARGTTTAQSLQDMLWSYGDSSDATSWSGADGTYSVPLPDGRVAWLFSDTFLGPVNSDGSRPHSAPFIHNSIIIQNGTSLSTLTGHNANGSTTLINPVDPLTYYWMGDGVVENNELLVFVDHFVQGLQQIGTDVARFSLPSMQLEGITSLPLAFVPGYVSVPVSYGASVLQHDGYDYIYGVADAHIGKDLYIARVRQGHLLSDSWEYWGINGWSSIPLLATSIASNSANELSISAIGGGFVMVNQANSIGKAIMVSKASAPEGPWSAGVDVFDTPEGGNLTTYNAKAHAEYSTPSSLVISYNVNSVYSSDLYANVDNYRPRFIQVPL